MIQNWKLTCLVSVSYHNLLYSPDLAPLDFRLFPDLTKELTEWFETTLELRIKSCEVFFFHSVRIGFR